MEKELKTATYDFHDQKLDGGEKLAKANLAVRQC
jgi:hypothetical protein